VRALVVPSLFADVGQVTTQGCVSSLSLAYPAGVVFLLRVHGSVWFMFVLVEIWKKMFSCLKRGSLYTEGVNIGVPLHTKMI